MIICNKEQCFGCGACAVSCPKGCITMQLDEHGFDRPVIDETQCVHCNACVKVCCNIRKLEAYEPKETYAAWIRDENEHKTSSSGGISHALVENIIGQGGVAFGATWTSDLYVCHVGTDCLETAKAFKSSKYVQSRTLNTYREVKQALTEGKKVLYTGTPCQIAGLRAYTGGHENLFLVDLICHGTPSATLLHEHISAIEKQCGKKADDISFRGRGLQLNLASKGEIFYSKKSTDDIWYIGFLKGLFYKSACYDCPFANRARISDITIGDFWGLNDDKIINEAKNGVSVMLINTEQGKKLFDCIKDKIVFYSQPTEKAVKGNKQLQHPMKMHRNHKKFYRLLNKQDFDVVARKMLRKERMVYWIAKRMGRA